MRLLVVVCLILVAAARIAGAPGRSWRTISKDFLPGSPGTNRLGGGLWREGGRLLLRSFFSSSHQFPQDQSARNFLGKVDRQSAMTGVPRLLPAPSLHGRKRQTSTGSKSMLAARNLDSNTPRSCHHGSTYHDASCRRGSRGKSCRCSQQHGRAGGRAVPRLPSGRQSHLAPPTRRLVQGPPPAPSNKLQPRESVEGLHRLFSPSASKAGARTRYPAPLLLSSQLVQILT